MSVASVNLTGALTLPTGQPAALASVRFTLSNPGLKGTTVVVPISTRATTDANGFFSIRLAPNAKNTYYTVTVYRSTGVVILEAVAVIPNVDCDFTQVIQVGQPTTLNATVSALVDLKVAQASIEVARLNVLATAVETKSSIEVARRDVLANVVAANTSSQASLVQFQADVNVSVREAEDRIERARKQVSDTADSAKSDSKDSLNKLQSSVDTYERLIASTQSTVGGVVDSAIGTSFDLVTAYQLST